MGRTEKGQERRGQLKGRKEGEYLFRSYEYMKFIFLTCVQHRRKRNATCRSMKAELTAIAFICRKFGATCISSQPFALPPIRYQNRRSCNQTYKQQAIKAKRSDEQNYRWDTTSRSYRGKQRDLQGKRMLAVRTVISSECKVPTQPEKRNIANHILVSGFLGARFGQLARDSDD